MIAAYNDYRAERPILLKLATTTQKSVDLFAVNEDGDARPGGHLLTICDTGLYMHSGVSPDIGLPLDDCQRLKVRQPAEPEVIQLLKPLAEFIAARRKVLGHENANYDYLPIGQADGIKLTIGQLQALADYYEYHK